MLALGMATGLVFSVLAPVTVVYGGSTDVTGTGTITTSGGTYSGDIIGGQLTNGSTDIAVQAKVSGGEIVYDLDVAWGTMQFEYSYGSIWDPEEHEYSGGQTSAGWVAGLDGTNNKIYIRNNSNFPMIADFSSSITDGVLNASATTDGSVAGIFADDNSSFTQDLLKQGYNSADPADPPYIKQLILEMDSAKLTNTGDTYYFKAVDGGEFDKNVFFALSGTPDIGRSTQYTSAGNITVSITPATGATRIVVP